MRKRQKLPKLDYRTQNQIQRVATANGVILSYEQMVDFARYRCEPAFSQSTDKQILYIVLTHGQREYFDQRNR